MYVLSLVLLAAFAGHGLRASAAVSAPAGRLYVIDAGHGGMDGGASGYDGTLESTLNLAIARRVDAVLGLLGEETLMLRTGEDDLSSADAKSVSQKKVSDIRTRTQIVNSHPGALLLSIHCNTYPEEKYRGAQVFYTPSDSVKALAQALQGAIKTSVDPENARQAKPVSPDVYLMNHIKGPGLLIECGFLSNHQELRRLEDPGYQNQLAIVIALTVVQHPLEDLSSV